MIVEIQNKDGSWSADLSDGVCCVIYIEALNEASAKSDLRKFSDAELQIHSAEVSAEIFRRQTEATIALVDSPDKARELLLEMAILDQDWDQVTAEAIQNFLAKSFPEKVELVLKAVELAGDLSNDSSELQKLDEDGDRDEFTELENSSSRKYDELVGMLDLITK